MGWQGTALCFHGLSVAFVGGAGRHLVSPGSLEQTHGAIGWVGLLPKRCREVAFVGVLIHPEPKL